MNVSPLNVAPKVAFNSTIIFDFDGTIVDSNSIKEKAIRQALRNNEEHALEHEFAEYFTSHNGIPREIKIARYFSEPIKQQRILEDYNAQLAIELKFASLTEGIIEFLKQAITNGCSLYVLSGGDRNEVLQTIGNHQLGEFFKGVYGGPDTKEQNLKHIFSHTKPIFIGDSKVDHQLAAKHDLDFIFISGYTQMENWQAYCYEYELSNIRNFHDLEWEE